MRISAKADYAVRAAIELAAGEAETAMTSEAIATAQGIPRKFLEAILGDLRRAGLVRSVRGLNGGYHLAAPAREISVADVIRAVDGPLMSVRGARPPELDYSGTAQPLLPVWIAVRASVRAVLETVSLEALATDNLPEDVKRLAADALAWENP
jgi:Rrf2 family protein